jgi:hypothetical protein
MAEIAQDLITFLSQDTGVSAIIGAGDHSRLFDHIARQRVCYPLIVVDEAGGTASNQLDGQNTNLAQSQFIIYSMSSRDKEQAVEVWQAVQDALRYYQGVMETTFVHGANIEGPWRNRSYFVDDAAGQEHVYYVQATYDIWYDPVAVLGS